MRALEIGSEITANIRLGNGQERACRATVKGSGSWGVRIEMIDAAAEVDLPAGVQTIIGWDRVPA